MKPTLFEIAANYRADIAKLGDMDLDETTIADTLEGMDGELTVKARNIAAFAADLDMTVAGMKEAEARMRARRQAVESRATRLRQYLLAGMQLAGVERIEGPDFVLSIKKNPPSVEVFDERMVPADYMKQPEPPPPAIDKALVKQAIKDGFDVPGCRLTQGVRLSIE